MRSILIPDPTALQFRTLYFVLYLRLTRLDFPAAMTSPPSPTLSGGEAQRVKLATELSKGITATGPAANTLYILDEPTTGLHFEDIRKLLRVLNRLADAGNTLVVIEHNLDVIKCADWIIDLGPQGGAGGGTIVAQGTPEQVVRTKHSYTGQFLAPLLTQGRNRRTVTVRTSTQKTTKRTSRKTATTRTQPS